MKVKEENENLGLKLNIKKTKIMASDPINSWGIDGKLKPLFLNFGFETKFFTLLFHLYQEAL